MDVVCWNFREKLVLRGENVYLHWVSILRTWGGCGAFLLVLDRNYAYVPPRINFRFCGWIFSVSVAELQTPIFVYCVMWSKIGPPLHFLQRMSILGLVCNQAQQPMCVSWRTAPVVWIGERFLITKLLFGFISCWEYFTNADVRSACFRSFSMNVAAFDL